MANVVAMSEFVLDLTVHDVREAPGNEREAAALKILEAASAAAPAKPTSTRA